MKRSRLLPASTCILLALLLTGCTPAANQEPYVFHDPWSPVSDTSIYFFRFGSATLDPATARRIASISPILQRMGATCVRINGHADVTEKDPWRLSVARAGAVSAFLSGKSPLPGSPHIRNVYDGLGAGPPRMLFGHPFDPGHSHHRDTWVDVTWLILNEPEKDREDCLRGAEAGIGDDGAPAALRNPWIEKVGPSSTVSR